MNKDRRMRLQRACTILRKMEEYREEAYEILAELACEEQEAYEHLPPSLQESERGIEMEECFDELQSAADELDAMDIPDPSNWLC